MFESGSVLVDRYLLRALLGAGAAGSVWEADDTRAGRRVAIKTLHAELATHEEIRARFLTEARASKAIAHPNVVDVFDEGEAPDGTPFMAMELCDGETLDAIVQLRGAVGPTYACELVGQVLSALEAAHALGIVHRDLKPANIMVVHPRPSQPVCKVLDFGIAKGVYHEGVDISEERGRIFGTPTYMAPEQAAGGDVDERADVYAAGAILFELLTGRPPFVGDSPSMVLADVLTRPPMPMRAFDRSIPAELDKIVRGALSKDAGDRPQGAREFLDQIDAWIPTDRESMVSLPDFGTERPLPLVAAPADDTRAEASPQPAEARLVLTESVAPPAQRDASSSEIVSPSDFDDLAEPIDEARFEMPRAPKRQGIRVPPPRPVPVPAVDESDIEPAAPSSRRLLLLADETIPPPPDEDGAGDDGGH